MEAFQAIADANPGLDGHPSRNSGEPGYWESAQYVKHKMEAAGYAVRLQPYTFTYTSFVGTPIQAVPAVPSPRQSIPPCRSAWQRLYPSPMSRPARAAVGDWVG